MKVSAETLRSVYFVQLTGERRLILRSVSGALTISRFRNDICSIIAFLEGDTDRPADVTNADDSTDNSDYNV